DRRAAAADLDLHQRRPRRRCPRRDGQRRDRLSRRSVQAPEGQQGNDRRGRARGARAAARRRPGEPAAACLAAGRGRFPLKSTRQTPFSPGRGKSRNGADDSIAAFMAQWRTEKPSLDVSPLGVLGRIQRLSIYFRDRAEEWLNPMDLTWESFSILAALRRSGRPYELRPTDM